MKIKEYKFILSLKEINGKKPDFYFDSFGKRLPKNKRSEIKYVMPLTIFYLDGFYYYLLCKMLWKNSDGNALKEQGEIIIYNSRKKARFFIEPEKYYFFPRNGLAFKYKVYVRINQIFKISEKDLDQIVDYSSQYFWRVESLLDSKYIYDIRILNKIKWRLWIYLNNSNSKLIALTETKLEDNQLKAKPLYAHQSVLKFDKEKNDRSETEYQEILNKVNPENLSNVNYILSKINETLKPKEFPDENKFSTKKYIQMILFLIFSTICLIVLIVLKLNKII